MSSPEVKIKSEAGGPHSRLDTFLLPPKGFPPNSSALIIYSDEQEVEEYFDRMNMSQAIIPTNISINTPNLSEYSHIFAFAKLHGTDMRLERDLKSYLDLLTHDGELRVIAPMMELDSNKGVIHPWATLYDGTTGLRYAEYTQLTQELVNLAITGDAYVWGVVTSPPLRSELRRDGIYYIGTVIVKKDNTVPEISLPDRRPFMAYPVKEYSKIGTMLSVTADNISRLSEKDKINNIT